LKYFFKNFLIKIVSLIPNKAELFCYDLGISSLTEKKLDIIFSQLPRFYNTKFKFKYSQYDKNLRNNINFDNFEKNIHLAEIINLLLKILKKSLPKSILEDYKFLEKKTEKINFPKSPKYIFTSYAFESNELFKYYLANQKKKNNNVKYIVYQHGGSYITRIDNSYNNECKTADKFLCWGDKIDKNLNNNINFFNFKLSNKKYFLKNNSNKLLVILRSSGYNAVPYDRYLEGKKELEFTLDFLKKIPDNMTSDVIIRAHSGSKGKLKMYNDTFHRFEIDYGDKNYFKSINNSKIIFFNHDSTGLLEILGCNKPTICAWPNFSNHLNKNIEEDYKYLIEGKILFQDNDDLLKHLNQFWQNPEKWWLNEHTQNCIKKFINLYSKKPEKNYLKDLKKTIINS
ncbi:MAG: hypothetical protein CMI79_03035, partial [Candidatus Pelagibacter sp.]|nr:hypothetical protein [Candidatus Pelagibacter sp.]